MSSWDTFFFQKWHDPELKIQVMKLSRLLCPYLIFFDSKFQWLKSNLDLSRFSLYLEEVHYLNRLLTTMYFLPITVHLDWSSCLFTVFCNKALKPSELLLSHFSELPWIFQQPLWNMDVTAAQIYQDCIQSMLCLLSLSLRRNSGIIFALLARIYIEVITKNWKLVLLCCCSVVCNLLLLSPVLHS